jgi:hypothetical protein
MYNKEFYQTAILSDSDFIRQQFYQTAILSDSNFIRQQFYMETKNINYSLKTKKIYKFLFAINISAIKCF